MALLDGDRFEGRFRDGVHTADVSDLMRRMVKENLLKFDATPLFPERIAHTVPYKLSDPEAAFTRPSPTTSATSSTGPRRWRTKAAGTVGLPSPSCSAGSLPRPRRSTSRCAPPRTPGEPVARAGNPPARRSGQRNARRAGTSLDSEDVEDLEEAPDAEVEAAESRSSTRQRPHAPSRSCASRSRH